jgi:hypothetical protein
MSEKPSRQVNRQSRSVEKAESRKEDLFQLSQGEQPNDLQRQNSIFPEGFFRKGKISNLAQAVGR